MVNSSSMEADFIASTLHLLDLVHGPVPLLCKSNALDDAALRVMAGKLDLFEQQVGGGPHGALEPAPTFLKRSTSPPTAVASEIAASTKMPKFLDTTDRCLSSCVIATWVLLTEGGVYEGGVVYAQGSRRVRLQMEQTENSVVGGRVHAVGLRISGPG